MGPSQTLRNIPEDPTERVEKAGALLDNLGRSLRTVRESANELANAGAVLAEKGDRLADVASACGGKWLRWRVTNFVEHRHEVEIAKVDSLLLLTRLRRLPLTSSWSEK